jgi:hypothetical protein
MRKYLFRSGLACAVALAAIHAPSTVAAPQLIKLTHTSQTDRVTVTNLARPNATSMILNASNPVIEGNNLYAPDLLRVGNSWYCYHGGWLTDGQASDRIYLGISASMDLAGPWNPASREVVREGTYLHVNDPTVVVENGTWHMLYTAFKVVGSDARDWINYSTSTDGINWSPSAGTIATEIAMTDPDNIAGGKITDIARPSLVRTPTRWELWFDARADNGDLTSFLAYGTAATPTSFTLVHKYSAVGGFPGFYEPDVVRRPDGTYLAVIQRYFQTTYIGTSADGINFDFAASVSATNAAFGRDKISNPGLAYDQITDQLLGLGFGMTDSTSLVGHDIGFSFSQYDVCVRSPDNTWHCDVESSGSDSKSIMTPGCTALNRIQIYDPVADRVALNQDFSNAVPGDVWRVQWTPDEPVIALPTPDPDTVRARVTYTQTLSLLAGAAPVTWSLAIAPEGATIDAQGTISGWKPAHTDVGQTFAFEARAQNAAGMHVVAWQVAVLRDMPDFDGDDDIDQSDFGRFQLCLTQSGITQTDPACEGADLDYDTDVDTADLTKFAGCMGGPDVSVDAACLD